VVEDGRAEERCSKGSTIWANPVYSCRITHLSILEKILFPEEIGKLQVFNQLDIEDTFLALHLRPLLNAFPHSQVRKICTLVSGRYTVAYPQ